jgi:hypothetical protein
METDAKVYLQRIQELEKQIAEKDRQIKHLEDVIQRMYALYGIKKEAVYKTREDSFIEVETHK